MDFAKLLADSFAQNTKLPWYEEAKFQNTMSRDPRYLDWINEMKKQYGESPNLNAPEYDYRAAVRDGVFPQRDPYDENRLHWDSRYKSPVHPRRFLGGEEMGRDPTQVYDTDNGQALSPMDIAVLSTLFGKNKFMGF